VEPLTHALASLTLSRAAFNRKTKLAPAIFLVAGTAADIDWVTYLFGPSAFVAGHRTVTHSLLGTIAVALAVSAAFMYATRKHESLRVPFRQAFLMSAAGAALHLALDLCDSYGAALLWPFGRKRFAADFLAGLDLLVLGVLLAGLLLPSLFALVSEEIGAGKKGPRGRRGAILALVVLALYLGGRALLHQKAVAVMEARTYRGEIPRQAAAFPQATSPLEWRGIVETESAMHQVPVSLAPGASFNPDAGTTIFKPEPSAILESAQQTRAAKEFLFFARFPKATVQKTAEGYTVELRDLRFSALGDTSFAVMAVVELDSQGRIVSQELRYQDRDAR
jgi:inner membrane protein